MAMEPTIALLDAASVVPRSRGARLYATVSDYWALTKPEVNFLILITTFAGFYLAPSGRVSGFRAMLIVRTLLGTVLVAGGAGTLNQFVERYFDARMRRTARRPLASGRLEASHVLWFGILLSTAGTAYLALAVNALTSLLAAASLVSYLFLYTPLKRKTPFCTLVGAFPGAAPPLIGWAAARGQLDWAAGVLYAIVFLWQFPHFMAIAWMYREDYSRAGYLVLPAGEWRERFVVWQSFFVSLALVPVTLIPASSGQLSLFYAYGVLMLGLLFSYYNMRFAFLRSNVRARRLLIASIIYLPAVFILLILDRK